MTAAMPAEAGPIGYAASRAVLIGVSEYRDGFTRLPAAENSLQAMYDLLTDPVLCGWPEDRVTVVRNPEHAGRLAQLLRHLAEATQDVLLLYFVGHGTLTP